MLQRADQLATPPLVVGWWAALPVAALLVGLAGLVGAADPGRRLVAAALVAGGVAGAVVLRRRRSLEPLAGGLRAPWHAATGAAGAFLVGGAVAAVLLERGTWWAALLTGAWAVLGLGAGALATWCVVRELDEPDGHPEADPAP